MFVKRSDLRDKYRHNEKDVLLISIQNFYL